MSPPPPNLPLTPFAAAPPPLPAALQAAYDAFADYEVAYPLCPTCFGAAGEAAMRAARPAERAPYEAFRQLYFEHPNCSGGVASFKHWLPRGLELGGFDMEVYFSTPLSEQMARLGVLDWPETERTTLRNLFCRAAVDWFERGETALGVVHHKTEGAEALYDGEGIISGLLITSLALLRVEPESMAQWLLARTADPAQAAKAWRGLAEGLWLDSFVDPYSYLALPQGQNEAAYRAALRALASRTQQGYAAVLRPVDLVAALEGAAPQAAKLIDQIADELDALAPADY